MQGEVDPEGVARGDDATASLPAEADKLRAGDVVQLSQGHTKRSFGLFYGKEHVIHSWSPSRRNFRVRVDSLRTLKLAGYIATPFSKMLDTFFLDLLKLTPVDSTQVVQRAKTALHIKTTSSSSCLSLVLLARYGDEVFEVLKKLNQTYAKALEGWLKGAPIDDAAPSFDEKYPFGDQLYKNPLDAIAGPQDAVEGGAEAARVEGPSIAAFLGSCGEYLISEWLKRTLSDFLTKTSTPNCWYPIAPASRLPPVFMMYDKAQAVFTIRFRMNGGLPERMAGDRMECGVCWMDFTSLKVMVMKCSHYICAPCLQMLPRRVCPFCREPIRFTFEVTEQIKQEALRLMLGSLAFDDTIAEQTELEQESPALDAATKAEANDEIVHEVEVLDVVAHEVG